MFTAAALFCTGSRRRNSSIGKSECVSLPSARPTNTVDEYRVISTSQLAIISSALPFLNVMAPGAYCRTSFSARARSSLGWNLKIIGRPLAIGDGIEDERLPILAAEDLPQRRRADEHVVAVRKGVVAIALAMVEVRDAGDHDLLRLRALADEEVAVPVARDAEGAVGVAQARGGGARDPERKPAVPLHEAEAAVLRIGDAFLDQDDPVAADVLLHEDIGAGDHEVVRAAPPLVVDGEMLRLRYCRQRFASLSPMIVNSSRFSRRIASSTPSQ